MGRLVERSANEMSLYSSGWSFGLAVVGAVTALISSALFFTELTIQEKKKRQFKESQSRFEMNEGR